MKHTLLCCKIYSPKSLFALIPILHGHYSLSQCTLALSSFVLGHISHRPLSNDWTRCFQFVCFFSLVPSGDRCQCHCACGPVSHLHKHILTAIAKPNTNPHCRFRELFVSYTLFFLQMVPVNTTAYTDCLKENCRVPEKMAE